MKKLLMLTATGLIAASVPALAEHHEGGDHDKGEKVRAMLAEIDTNSDGAISKEEYMAHAHAKAEARFAEKDTDGDGVISQEEGKANMEKKREEMKSKHEEMRKKHKEKLETIKEESVPEADVDAGVEVDAEASVE